jgi:hypothetical protein
MGEGGDHASSVAHRRLRLLHAHGMIEMEPTTIIAILLILCTAFFFAPLGLGGGVLFVPIFLYVMEWEMRLSLISSLILVLMVSIGSRNAHSKGGYAVMEIGKFAIAPAIIGAVGGAIIGAYLIEYVGDFTIKIAATSLLVWVIVRTIKQLTGESNGTGITAIEPREIESEVITRYKILCLGGGAASGLLGIGGGMLFVTFHRSLFTWKVHYAAGTSYVIETWLVPVSIFSHLVIGHSSEEIWPAVEPWMLVTMLLVFASAWIGARTAIKTIPQQFLAYPFLIALIVTLTRYCLDIFGVSPA